MTQYYTWKKYQCAYETHNADDPGTPLILIHPIGVGLSRQFWQRFIKEWYNQGNTNPIYNPDLLGCGESAMPRVAYYPEDWADQLKYFAENIVQKPSILIAQGALMPVGIYCSHKFPNLIKGLVASGPPAWELMQTATPESRHIFAWNLFNTPLGNLFFRYARRRSFLESFSIRQLFEKTTDVDTEWLEQLKMGANYAASRHAVFSFLSGFWRQNYQEKIETIPHPTLLVFGEAASSISKEGKQETAEQRLKGYLDHLKQGTGRIIPGRNVLPYESTHKFVSTVSEFVKENG